MDFKGIINVDVYYLIECFVKDLMYCGFINELFYIGIKVIDVFVLIGKG